MTIMHCESTRLQCRGCFATLSMTFTNALYIETIFEMASKKNFVRFSVFSYTDFFHALIFHIRTTRASARHVL